MLIWLKTPNDKQCAFYENSKSLKLGNIFVMSVVYIEADDNINILFFFSLE